MDSKYTEPFSRSTMKRVRSTEEPHPVGQEIANRSISSANICGVNPFHQQDIVTGSVPKASTDPSPGKAKKKTT